LRENGRYLDGTFGRGGHASAILARLSAEGRLFLMDRDPSAIANPVQIPNHSFGRFAGAAISATNEG